MLPINVSTKCDLFIWHNFRFSFIRICSCIQCQQLWNQKEIKKIRYKLCLPICISMQHLTDVTVKSIFIYLLWDNLKCIAHPHQFTDVDVQLKHGEKNRYANWLLCYFSDIFFFELNNIIAAVNKSVPSTSTKSRTITGLCSLFSSNIYNHIK